VIHYKEEILKPIGLETGTKLDPKRMASIHKAVAEIFTAVDSQSIEDMVLDHARRIIGEGTCSLFVLFGSQGAMKLFREKSEQGGEVRRTGESAIVSACLEDRLPVHISDADARIAPDPFLNDGARSVLALPMVLGDQALGAIMAQSSRPDAYSEGDMLYLGIFSGMVGTALKNAEKFRSLEKMAVTDGLTGLFNSRYFHARLEEEIARATRYGRSLSVILLDLDDFKKVNDLYGHLRGDDVLKQVAKIIIGNTRRSDSTTIMKSEGDAAARYGGDEFMILLPETTIDGAVILANRLKNLISIEVAGEESAAPQQPLIIRASLGVAGMRKDETARQLIARADAALYEAKSLGKNRVAAGD
jgi:diguanylate cyclase (GGDEF)-like protein